MLQLVIGPSTVGVGAQGPPDQRHVAHDREATPGIQALSGDHDVVGLSRLTFGCGKDHVVATALQDPPTDRHFGGVKVERGEWEQHEGHGSWAAI
jgi:hypothetical protein